jgi:hypothetical protein
MFRRGSHFPKQADLAGGFCEKTWERYQGSGWRFSFKKVGVLAAPSPVVGWVGSCLATPLLVRPHSRLLSPFKGYQSGA